MKNAAVRVKGNDEVTRFTSWVQQLRLEAELPDEEEFDPAVIIQNILIADTLDEAISAQSSSLLSAKNDMLDVAHTVTGFRLRRSDDKYVRNDRSLGVFAVVEGVRKDTGDHVTYWVGAANVIAVLWQAREREQLPGDFVISGRETDNGLLLFMRRS
jgi:hypothetical protein